jgi:hypothetical protein
MDALGSDAGGEGGNGSGDLVRLDEGAGRRFLNRPDTPYDPIRSRRKQWPTIRDLRAWHHIV